MALNEQALRLAALDVVKALAFTAPAMLYLDYDPTDAGELIEPVSGNISAWTIGVGDDNGDNPGAVRTLSISEYAVDFTHTLSLFLDAQVYTHALAMSRSTAVLGAFLREKTLQGAVHNRWAEARWVTLRPAHFGRHPVWLSLFALHYTQVESGVVNR